MESKEGGGGNPTNSNRFEIYQFQKTLAKVGKVILQACQFGHDLL